MDRQTQSDNNSSAGFTSRAKNELKTPACIFRAYPLVKFSADSFTIQGDT